MAQPSALPRDVTDHFFLSTDGVRLHYLEAGPPGGHTLVFVPGWTMPAWIWMPQILAFSRHYHVVAFDPRGQGDSAVPAGGYEPVRRGRDVAELISRMWTGDRWWWSAGRWACWIRWPRSMSPATSALAGLVLVDNSVGEEPPPPPFSRCRGVRVRRRTTPQAMKQFVRAHVPPRAAAGCIWTG